MQKARLLFIPLDWKKKNVQMYMFEAFKERFDVTYFDGAGSDLLKKKPKYIYVQSGAISVNELQAIKTLTGARVFQWTGDCREEPLDVVTQYKGVVDQTYLACANGQRKEYESLLEHPVYYLQHAGCMFLEAQELSEGGVSFVGNYYDQFEGGAERNRLCYELDKKYGEDFYCFGSWIDSRGQVPYDDTPWIYNNAYISISANIFNHIEGYWSNRPYDILAAGSCCLMRYVPGIEEHFTDMDHCVYYHSNDEAIEKIEWLKQNPEIRNRIAKAGHEHVKANHTYKNRVDYIWETLL